MTRQRLSFFQRCLWIEHIHSYRIYCYDWEDPPVGAQPFLSSGLAQLWWSLRWILERTLEQIEKSEMWQVWGYPLVNIQKAIENSHRNSWLSHKNGDFPVRYVNVYQRVSSVRSWNKLCRLFWDSDVSRTGFWNSHPIGLAFGISSHPVIPLPLRGLSLSRFLESSFFHY